MKTNQPRIYRHQSSTIIDRTINTIALNRQQVEYALLMMQNSTIWHDKPMIRLFMTRQTNKATASVPNLNYHFLLNQLLVLNDGTFEEWIINKILP